jgi:hypothetical protein
MERTHGEAPMGRTKTQQNIFTRPVNEAVFKMSHMEQR